MCLGLPVVTCSTPWVDNAQVEQVDPGETGWLADHPRQFAEAVASLLADDDDARGVQRPGPGEVGRALRRRAR